LERAKAEFLKKGPLAFRLRLVRAGLRGEPIESGNFIPFWSLRGPFRGQFEKDFLGGEASFSNGKGRFSNAWRRIKVDVTNPTHCLGVALGRPRNASAYAATELWSSVKQPADFCLGTGSGFAAWFNGSLIGSKLGERRVSSPDQERFRLILKKGKNTLLLKVTQREPSWWGFHARFQGLAQPLYNRHP
jgi:hypothetical protein